MEAPADINTKKNTPKLTIPHQLLILQIFQAIYMYTNRKMIAIISKAEAKTSYCKY
jgi:hypothetical protein